MWVPHLKNTALASDNHICFRKNLIEDVHKTVMAINKKIKDVKV